MARGTSWSVVVSRISKEGIFKHALKAPMRAGYRPGDMITSQMTLLYTYTLFLIERRDCRVEDFTLRNLLARWFFLTPLTGRYTNSPETVMEQDLFRLRDIKDATGFVAFLDHIISDTLTEDYWNITLPNELAVSAARSPSLIVYHAALSLLDARVLFSKMKVSELLDPAMKARNSALERHHLFPKGYLVKLGIKELRETNQITNYDSVEWSANVGISDYSPANISPGAPSVSRLKMCRRCTPGMRCGQVGSGWIFASSSRLAVSVWQR